MSCSANVELSSSSEKYSLYSERHHELDLRLWGEPPMVTGAVSGLIISLARLDCLPAMIIDYIELCQNSPA